MYDHLLKKFDCRLNYVFPLFGLVIVVIPGNSLSLLIIGDKSAFCHGRAGGVTHHITHTSGDIFGIGTAGCFGIVSGGSGIYIESFVLIYITFVCVRNEIFSKLFLQQVIQLILSCFAETGEVEVMEWLDTIVDRIVDHLRDKCVDMRIPFQIPSKCMYRCEHSKNHGIFKVPVKIGIIFIVVEFAGLTPLSLFFPIDAFVCNFAYGVSGGDKKKIQS